MLIALESLSNRPLPWVRFALLTLLLAYPYIHAIEVSLQSRNANSVRTWTIASAFYNMCCQISSIISSNIYRADDAPYYKRGNKVLLGIVGLNIGLYILTKLYYVWKNQRREKIWSAMSVEEREKYIKTTTDKGNKRLDFRFAHWISTLRSIWNWVSFHNYILSLYNVPIYGYTRPSTTSLVPTAQIGPELSPMRFRSRELAYHRKRYCVFLVLKRHVVRIALTASCCNRTHQPWTHPHVTYYKRCESRNSSLDFKGIRQLRTVCLYKSWYEFNGYILASYLK